MEAINTAWSTRDAPSRITVRTADENQVAVAAAAAILIHHHRGTHFAVAFAGY